MAKHITREVGECEECQKPLMHNAVCSNCGAYEKWEEAKSSASVFGIFCKTCGKGFTYLHCDHCGHPQPTNALFGGVKISKMGPAGSDAIRRSQLSPEELAKEDKENAQGCYILVAIILLALGCCLWTDPFQAVGG